MTRFRGKAGWLLALAAVLIATFLSPVLVLTLGRILHEDWVTVGNIGQTYGFASATLSGLALLAVAYSLIFQQHESRTVRIENQRALHSELLRMAIEDPSLIGVIMIDPAENMELKRRHLYANLLVQSTRMSYVHSRVLDDETVRSEISYFFQGAVGRAYWQKRRDEFRKEAVTPRDARFFELLDQSYARAVRSGPPLPYPKSDLHVARRAKISSFAAGLGAGAAACLAAARMKSRHRRR
jgi:hypothetical protein